ncbi:MAG: LD-carboxypeptidase [Desulfobacteraceae bacterium]
MIQKPPILRVGNRVGVIAPAGPVTPDELDPGIRALEDFGLEVAPGEHLYDIRGYTAGDDRARAEDLDAMFSRPDIQAVFCARGGYGCMRLLPRIDMESIRANPKILMGYSDITSLLWALFAETGLVSFHGPVVKGFTEQGGQDLTRFFSWLRDPARPPEIDLSQTCRVLYGGRASGPVFGGNLSLVSHLVGTRFMPDLTGAILFLEETREPLYRIDRMLTHLALSGRLARLSGFLAGRFGENETSIEVDDLLRECFEPLGIPVLTGFPVGHGPVNTPVPIGLAATLDTDRMRLTWHESCFDI